MLNLPYARLLWRYLRRRLLTRAGWRWRSDGLLFFGRRLEIQIARGAEVRFGRFVWIGDGSKIRCHEGEVEIGAKTVIGQECTISAYRRGGGGGAGGVARPGGVLHFHHRRGAVGGARPPPGVLNRDGEGGAH